MSISSEARMSRHRSTLDPVSIQFCQALRLHPACGATTIGPIHESSLASSAAEYPFANVRGNGVGAWGSLAAAGTGTAGAARSSTGSLAKTAFR
jgi:hypothetical protein